MIANFFYESNSDCQKVEKGHSLDIEGHVETFIVVMKKNNKNEEENIREVQKKIK